MFKSFTKIFSMFLMGILINFSITGCGGSSSNDNPVESVKLVGVDVSPAHTYVEIGEAEQYIATAIFSNNTTQNVTGSATWRTSNGAIASINENGVAIGVNAGAVLITATYGEMTGVTKLDVLKGDPITDPVEPPVEPTPPVGPPPPVTPPATFVSLTIEGSDVLVVGETEQMNAIVTLSDGTTYIANDKVNWFAAPSKFATIDATGLVTGIDTGVAGISATAKSDKSIIAVHDISVTDVDVQLQSIQIKNIAGTVITDLAVAITTEEYVEAWGVYSDGSTHNINADVVWWSDDQQIASINYFKSSYVYGRELGTTAVRALFAGVEGSVNVTVVNNGPVLESIEIDARGIGDVTGGSIDVAVGGKQWLTSFGNYSDGTRVDINSKVFYSSEDTSIAYVIDEINSNVYGKAVGSTTINVDWQGVNAKVTANVIEP